MNCSMQNTQRAESAKGSTAASEDVETRANRLAANQMAKEAVAGLRKLDKEKAARKAEPPPAQVASDAPPLVPSLPQEEFDRMSLKEAADFLGRPSQAAIARYAPDLFGEENPAFKFGPKPDPVKARLLKRSPGKMNSSKPCSKQAEAPKPFTPEYEAEANEANRRFAESPQGRPQGPASRRVNGERTAGISAQPATEGCGPDDTEATRRLPGSIGPGGGGPLRGPSRPAAPGEPTPRRPEGSETGDVTHAPDETGPSTVSPRPAELGAAPQSIRRSRRAHGQLLRPRRPARQLPPQPLAVGEGQSGRAAAVRVARSHAQSSAILRAAVPAITRTLAGRLHSYLVGLRRASIEGRPR